MTFVTGLHSKVVWQATDKQKPSAADKTEGSDSQPRVWDGSDQPRLRRLAAGRLAPTEALSQRQPCRKTARLA